MEDGRDGRVSCRETNDVVNGSRNTEQGTYINHAPKCTNCAQFSGMSISTARSPATAFWSADDT
jgi:hypothetical protein